MKKIFFALVAIFGLWSCVQEDLPVVGPGTHDSDGGYVDITFGVVVPEMQDATRTMSTPAIERLHLLVFDDNGLLSEAVNAELDTLKNKEWGETSALTYYKATLARTDYKRTIHFVANSPYTSVVNDYPMSTESSLMTTMAVKEDQDAYWQRVVLPNGITGTRDSLNGQVIYVPTKEVVDSLSEVPLVRNHSRVRVVNALTEGMTQLKDMQFVLVNIPHSGTVAPFNINNGEFVSYTADTKYDTLVADNYQGYEPTDRDLINDSFTGDGALVCENNTAWVAAGGYHYLYERKQNLEPAAYVIVSGIYGTDANRSYYKIDIINNEGVSYNLLRNIEYTVNITKVLGSGFATAEEAYNAGPSNNLNFSVETKNLLNLSDGTSALYVEYTQKIINTSAATVTLRYKYIPDLAAVGTNNTDAVTIEYELGDVIAKDFNEGDGTTTADGWNTLSFTAGTVPTVGQSAKTQTITLSAGSLARQVEFILTNPYRLTLDMPDKVGDALGSAVNAFLYLEERLPYGIFPLEFIVVAENNSLSPDATQNTLPVVTGVNVDGTPGGQHFGYKVTYEWDQYYSVSGGVESYNTIIPLYFKTNMADSAPEVGSADGTDCYAYNQYHNIATDEFYNGDLYALTLELANSSVGYGVGQSVTATLRLPEAIADADWTDGEYLDFVISDSNSTLSLKNVVGGLKIGDNVVRVMKRTFDGGTRAIELTFTTTKIVSATTIYAENKAFKQASATLSNSLYNFTAININGSTQTSDIDGANREVKVNVTLPEGIPESIFGDNGLVLTLTATQNTLNAAGGTSGSGRTFTKTVSYTEYTASTSKIVTFDFTTNGNNVAYGGLFGTYPKTTTVTVSNEYFNDSDSRSFSATE